MRPRPRLLLGAGPSSVRGLALGVPAGCPPTCCPGPPTLLGGGRARPKSRLPARTWPLPLKDGHPRPGARCPVSQRTLGSPSSNYMEFQRRAGLGEGKGLESGLELGLHGARRLQEGAVLKLGTPWAPRIPHLHCLGQQGSGRAKPLGGRLWSRRPLAGPQVGGGACPAEWAVRAPGEAPTGPCCAWGPGQVRWGRGERAGCWDELPAGPLAPGWSSSRRDGGLPRVCAGIG